MLQIILAVFGGFVIGVVVVGFFVARKVIQIIDGVNKQ